MLGIGVEKCVCFTCGLVGRARLGARRQPLLSEVLSAERGCYVYVRGGRSTLPSGWFLVLHAKPVPFVWGTSSIWSEDPSGNRGPTLHPPPTTHLKTQLGGASKWRMYIESIGGLLRCRREGGRARQPHVKLHKAQARKRFFSSFRALLCVACESPLVWLFLHMHAEWMNG